MKTKTFYFSEALQTDLDTLMQLLVDKRNMGDELRNPRNPKTYSESALIKYLIRKELREIRKTLKPVLPKADESPDIEPENSENW